MDLNFGEIIIDPVSRAFFDEYDANINFNQPDIVWCIDECQRNIEKNIDHFIVVEGENAKNLLKDSVLHSNLKLICKIRNVDIFEVEEATMLCVAEEQELNYVASISDLLNTFINKANNVTIVSLQRASDLKADKIPDDCCIKGINSKFNDVEALKPPNFITGIGSAVSTKRLLSDQSFSCYIIYIDIYDEITINKILNHLNRIGLKYNECAKIRSFQEKSNLYM
ncbi:uncharacterized protein [Chironomus tepperi]|uniref:uncharacterized protein n=1 Tax=Chironomus tepperi TaxID=113505 RepID=UPI00391F7611